MCNRGSFKSSQIFFFPNLRRSTVITTVPDWPEAESVQPFTLYSPSADREGKNSSALLSPTLHIQSYFEIPEWCVLSAPIWTTASSFFYQDEMHTHFAGFNVLANCWIRIHLVPIYRRSCLVITHSWLEINRSQICSAWGKQALHSQANSTTELSFRAAEGNLINGGLLMTRTHYQSVSAHLNSCASHRGRD